MNTSGTSRFLTALNDAMGAFVSEGMKSGVILDTAGLKPTAQGTRVRTDKGKLSVTDGPFTENEGDHRWLRDDLGGVA